MAPLFRKSARARKNQSSRPWYREMRWFRPRLELLETRILLSEDNWIGGGSNWDVGSNWDLGHAPTSSDTAVINTTNAATITIHSGDSIQVQGITTGSNDTLSITGGSLAVTAAASTLSGALSISDGTVDFSTGNAIQIASLTQSGGTLQGSDTVTVTGQLVWSDGTMAGKGTTVAQGAALFNSGGPFNEDFLDTRTFQNVGTAVVEGGPYYLDVENGGSFQNLAGATLELRSNGGSIAYVGGATLLNQGTLRCIGNSSIEISANFINTGSIDVEGGSDLAIDDFSNGVPVAAGASSGVMTVEAGAKLELNGDYTLQDGASESGAGLLLINSTLTVNGTVTVQNLEQSATITGPGTLTVEGQLIWQGGTESGTGTTVAQGTVKLGGPSKITLDTRTFQNAGTFTWASQNFDQMNGSSFQNLAGATLDIQAVGAAWYNDQNNSTLVNQGTLKLSDGNADNIYADMINTGVIDVQPGRGSFLSFRNGFINGSGILACQSSSSLVFTGNLLGNASNANQFAPQGTVQLAGSGSPSAPQQLEVMSNDLGAIAAGLNQNFAYNTLALGSSAYVQLVDNAHNTSGTAPEALYAKSLIVPHGSTLDLNGLHVYARATQINGTVLNGQINQVPPGGTLAIGDWDPGIINSTYPTNDWTFFGRANQQVTVVVNLGSSDSTPPPLAPSLQSAQVQIEDSTGNVIASGTSRLGSGVVTLLGVVLPTEGTYHIIVSVPAAQSGSTGNYTIGLFDSPVFTKALDLNQTVTSQLYNGYQVDKYTFTAQANEQIQFNLVAASSSNLEYDLTGPNGYAAFSNATTSSGLITLPSDGAYTLTVHSKGFQTGAYAFNVSRISQTALTLGASYQGTLQGSGQAQQFTVDVPTAGQQLLIQLNDTTGTDRNQLYLSNRTAPTPSLYQYRSSNPGSANQQILVQSAAAGTWYILLYGNKVAAPSQFTLTATLAPVILSSVTPDHHGNNQDTVMTLTGAGFNSTTQVKLIASDGTTTYDGTSVQAATPTKMTATFAANAVPAGTYSVEVINSDGSTSTLPGAFKMVQGGTPNLVTKLVIPNPIGRHIASTLYVTYSNTGDAAMPAPLLELTAYNPAGLQGALMTLDPALRYSGFWTSAIPQGYSSTIQILASGATLGLLQPGESITVPVYYAGWLDSQWDFSNSHLTFVISDLTGDNTTKVDWRSLKSSLQPSGMSSSAWNVIYPNLTSQLGTTLGDYVQRLDQDASYLGSLGETETDLGQLWSFEIRQASGYSPHQTLWLTTDASVLTPGPALSVDRALPNTIDARTEMGPFGIGWQWTSGWQRFLSVGADGTVTITDPDGDAGPQQTIFQPDRRGGGSYFAEPGITETLTKVVGGYLLREQDGTATIFGTNGLIADVQDTHGNRVTAGYTNGLLTSLTASTGQSLSFTYNSAGLIQTVTDSSGRITTYSYDSSNTYLVSVTDFAGRTTTYTYDTSGSPATQNALLTIQNPDGTVVHFTYGTEGRLAQQYVDNGTPGSATSLQIAYSYGPVGEVSMTDAFGATTSYFADAHGMFVKMVDPLGNTTHYTYDENFNRTQVIDPAGQVTSYVYDQNGKPIKTTNPGGDVLAATYTGPFDKMSSSTDANGNTTHYSYDSQGNLLAITYPNGTEHQFSYDPIGDLTTSINGRGQAITSTYNSMGQITRETFADGTYLAYTYNSQGQMLTSTDGTNTTTFQYDPTTANLLQVTYPGGKYLKFSYDSAGRRTQSVDQDGFTVNYAYKLGLLAGLTDGSGSPIVTYTYDAEGRLVRKDMGNGTHTTYQYDLDGNILHLINFAPDGTANSRFDYTYNNLGRVSTMTTLDGAWAYQYDPDGHLTHAVFTSSNSSAVPNQDLQYLYDLAGNWMETIINGVTTTYVTNNMNQYTHVGSAKLSYDADGNLIQQTDSSGTTSYTYDELNRLTGVSSPTGTAAYQYDTLGNLAEVTQNGQVTRYVVDPVGLGNVVGEYASSGSPIAKYTYGLGLISRVDASGQGAYYDFDHIGSTVGMTGPTGSYQNIYRYQPFGATITSSATIPNVFQFVGQFGVMTQAIGQDFMRARFYSPDLGRFLSPDPLGLAGGQSVLYAYAAQNPLSFSDPIGLCETQAQKDATDAQYEEEIQQARNGLVVDMYILNTLAEDLKDTSNPLGSLVFYLAQQDMLDKIQQLEREIDILIAQKASYDDIPICSDNIPDNPPIPPPPPPSPPSPPPGPGTGGGGGTTVTTVSATDPNALYGPAGYGPSHFISLSNAVLFPYSIDFENASTATAPAQRVVITNQLDPNLDWTTFQLTSLGFGSNFVDVPANSQSYQTDVSMTYNGQTFNVNINASLNPTTGLLTVVFQSIDPSTSLPPANVLTGFLPPEDGTGRGTGFVSYIISPKSNLADGTQIRNVALVTFDGNPAISTDEVNDEDPTQGIDPNKQAPVTIDSAPPTSSVSLLPATENTLNFNVSWSGSDGSGSGIASYGVYVSDNGGAYTLWQNQTTQTSATYNGVNGHTYAFYSVAIDNVGNVQSTPSAAQATTTVGFMLPTSSVSALPAAVNSPNFMVNWSGSDPGGPGIASYNIYVSDNGGAFTLWQANTTQTSATYNGVNGHTYGFYSVATDNAGNVQTTPTSAQTTTLVVTTPPTSAVSALPSYSSGSFTLNWSGSATNGVSIVSYNVYVSDNGGAFTPLLTGTKQTSTTFAGVNGHTYDFYSVATDSAGNVQSTPSAAQATTTVDSVAPTSSASSLPAFSPTSFTISWSGSDDTGGSGLADYSVYVSDNGAAFAPLVTDTLQTSTSFTGVNGHSYGFYSIATDKAGNVQPAPTAAQANTTVDTTAPTSSVNSLPAIESSPSFSVSWSGSDPGGTGIASYNIYVSDNGGAFTLWLSNTTQTSATYTGQVGHTYGFYSVATDSLGLPQPTPTTAQAMTYVFVPSPPPSPSPSPPASTPPTPSAPPAPPTLQVPPLLALLDTLLGGVKTVDINGTETVTDSLFGFPLFVSTYNSGGELISVSLFGINITFLFE